MFSRPVVAVATTHKLTDVEYRFITPEDISRDQTNLYTKPTSQQFKQNNRSEKKITTYI